MKENHFVIDALVQQIKESIQASPSPSTNAGFSLTKIDNLSRILVGWDCRTTAVESDGILYRNSY
ncbi:hypothetical protein WAK64_00380 [Bacillus spongiae]|uniref:Uncharacterized protein n=1 Tax=Bacillus spongiae TaxID=2683610 RepID=A0ABU8H8C7_9BACI